jgi:hypothetical protein
MKRLGALGALTALSALDALAASFAARPAVAKPPPHPHWHAPPAPPAPPLATLPTLSRVRMEVARDRLVLILDVTLPRGEWEKGDLDLYVAFGAPGAPKAFDAHLVPLGADDQDAPLGVQGEAIATERAPHRPPSANLLLGPPSMAGEILHVKEAAYARALAMSGVAVVRVRELLDLPSEDARTGHEIVVRLGAPGGLPITVGRAEVASLDARPWVTRAEARLCGPEADDWPLSIPISPSPPERAQATDSRGTISPRMALRHASDDLCVRFWTASQ